MYIAKELKKKGVKIDVDLVSRACLLHDIAKVEEIKGNGKHNKIGEKMLSQEGYKELGKFCHNHYFGLEKKLKTLEEKILSYADNRVIGDKIVKLQTRLDDLNKRYTLKMNFKKAVAGAFEVEREIFECLDIKPNYLKKHLLKVS